MATTLTPSHPQFTFLFLAVRRAEVRALPHREAVIAPDEISARRLLARDYVLSFAGRLPLRSTRHV
ncbi:host cell division inhibitor Icd-like protein [Pectobacterium carotovorum subsp. carotovorum]|uniref:host cell division inhibitor Icd-like protein n=1 Tax=Pectobacterium carotovorum TaxID=554 RepID=UPI00137442EA|nr:host cell division inhibitor Icd-like protein [Pectobacterium carotovorum]QHP55530.1 host cell division inhibitor Icd-like protein [Pectobacterium carotovorum subsp. carotovorum]